MAITLKSSKKDTSIRASGKDAQALFDGITAKPQAKGKAEIAEMRSQAAGDAPICPKCGNPFSQHLSVEISGVVKGNHDPEGKARFDLWFTCDNCDAQWYAFLAVDDLIAVEEETQG